MKYVLTGSVGNISKPLAQQLIAAGHDVTIISTNESKKKEIEQLGAKAAIGDVNDIAFVAQTFKGADAAYVMIPPTWAPEDWPAHMKQVADNYVAAIKESGIKKVVQLSSIGAHLGYGAGPINGLAYFEKQLDKLENVDVLSLRPSYFYTNLFAMADLIRNAGIMGSNFGAADGNLVLTHPADIADAAAQRLLSLDFNGHIHQYVSSDVRTLAEVAETIGNAIGKPGLPWISFSDEEAYNGMLGAGLTKTIADGYLEMGQGIQSGILQEDYFSSGATPQGKVKLEDFAKDFAIAFV
ncbi:NAD(P)H-binding protein [Flavobacterium pallidum]|uniref:NAD-dependent dehydratase n=1 Tax=Flavobacterium pallidum TaxID=2172098 RepID=A0A2S1SEJ5_9FLAO|nr:NAD(P)H-binding protein [Flavobacterium pallidum]AWI24811.1 NAD-dependent dehydratase [Flavobacterium pallidum]